jgi:hypothetical protein
MRFLITIIFIAVLFPNETSAQTSLDQKSDYVWIFGYYNSYPNWGGTKLNFASTIPSTTYVHQQLNLHCTDAVISDSSGNLLFYTNGMYVANRNFQIMPNGDSINPGDLYNYYGNMGYRTPQGAIILRKPGTDNIYYIIHEKLEWSAEYFIICPGIHYSIIDMNLCDGLGDVIDKNIPLLIDSLEYGCITATRHANGRDWWIIVPEFLHNQYYKFLLTTNGIILYGTQTIGSPSINMEVGQACFSPDGTKYVRFAGTDVNIPYRLEVFDFDRCSGMLSNYRNLWYVDSAWTCGVAISANSRYMYTSAETHIDQYDLQAEDIAASRVIVAEYDGFVDPLFSLGSTHFFQAQLAPDNKIYLSATNGVQYLHVIENPNLPGLACNVQQHSVHLNTFNGMSLPNFPNFRLGAMPCSVCDSLGLGGSTLQGKLLYNDALFTPMDSCWIVLKTLAGIVVDSTLSDQVGEYKFCGVNSGEYKICPGTTKAWGGVNITDALLTMKHFVGLDSLQGLFLESGDVNASNIINSIDALQIQKRFVGLLNSFVADDWLFENPQISITGSATYNVDIRCLCSGDVNGSYHPSE